MTVATTPPSYAERRAAMADQTRTRILDACVAILARGVAELSIPAVAKEAAVSVPTVYRNFADKKTLVHETALHLRAMRGPVEMPATLDDLPDLLRQHFERSASINETVRAALASELVASARRDLGETHVRLQRTAELIGEATHGMSARERELAALVVTVLCSSATLRSFRDVAGTSPEDAADAVAWTIGRVLGRSFKKPRTRGGKR